MKQLYRVEQAKQLADRVFEMWIHAPQVARNARAGQFLIIRIDESGERIPLTISSVNADQVRVIFMAVGKTTYHLSTIRSGEYLLDVAGPLGKPSVMERFGTCVIVGGGVGIASTPIIAMAAREAGNYVIGILGARNAGLLILEEEMRGICDELHLATDDGSRGIHGFAADALRNVIAARKVDCTWIIGPAIMMKVTSEVTRPAGIRTFVSLNPVMVDGTGMCGSCRVVIDGQTRFACVDGPEFDAHKVNFDLLMQRQRTYLEEERFSLTRYNEKRSQCTEAQKHD